MIDSHRSMSLPGVLFLCRAAARSRTTVPGRTDTEIVTRRLRTVIFGRPIFILSFLVEQAGKTIHSVMAADEWEGLHFGFRHHIDDVLSDRD